MTAGAIILALSGFGAGLAFRNVLGNLWYGRERKKSDKLLSLIEHNM